MNRDKAESIMLSASGNYPVHKNCNGEVDENKFCHKCDRTVYNVQDIPTREELIHALEFAFEKMGTT